VPKDIGNCGNCGHSLFITIVNEKTSRLKCNYYDDFVLDTYRCKFWKKSEPFYFNIEIEEEKKEV
jgi:hypothetical protein